MRTESRRKLRSTKVIRLNLDGRRNRPPAGSLHQNHDTDAANRIGTLEYDDGELVHRFLRWQLGSILS